MKVLLIGEASGVHRNLQMGLQGLGVECLHMTHSDSTSWREFDDTFSPAYTGLAGKIARNVSPFLKISKLGKYDVINFANTITAVHGIYTRYFDIPIFRKKARLMSYYALGCDEIGIVRRNGTLPYGPCATCLASKDILSRDCESLFNKTYEKSAELVRRYFDYGACSVFEYDHVKEFFGTPLDHIPFPVDISRIPFSPAKSKRVVNVIHTPTRRGFKGTDIVLKGIEILKQRRSDFDFSVVEGLSYQSYLEKVVEADIVIDQVYSQSSGMNGLEMLAAGKIVFTGASELGRSYFDFGKESPAFDAPPDPSQLAERLSEVLDCRKEFPSLAEQGRSYVARNHSLAGVAEKFLKAWQARL